MDRRSGAGHRRGLDGLGLVANGGPFPVQTLAHPSIPEAADLHRRLRQRGIAALLRRGGADHRPGVSLVITVRHEPADIDAVVASLAAAAAVGRPLTHAEA